MLYDYDPQREDDLQLVQGEMVTLLEAPAGGTWWRGTVNNKEGWFPKSYVEYVDVKAEEQAKKRGNEQLF